MILTILTTVGLAQLSAVFASPPPQGGNPHDVKLGIDSTEDPHSLKAPKGNPHLCETIESGGSESSGPRAGKVVIKQC
jgi:hypothetical protein